MKVVVATKSNIEEAESERRRRPIWLTAGYYVSPLSPRYGLINNKSALLMQQFFQVRIFYR